MGENLAASNVNPTNRQDVQNTALLSSLSQVVVPFLSKKLAHTMMLDARNGRIYFDK